MKQKFFATLLALSSVISMNTAAAATYQFQSGPPVEYSLEPNKPQEFANIFMWKAKATCKILTQESQVPIAFTVLRKSGSVNNIKMSTGDSITLVFYPNQTVDITAESGGVVRLENLGTKTISASCATA